MISGDRLLEIDLRSRTVATVLKSPDLISLDTLNLGPAAMTDPRLVRLVVRTSQRVLLLDGAGKQVGAYVIPPELRDGKICFYDLHGPTALLNATHTLRDHTRRERLLWIDASGRVVRQTEFTLAGSNRPYNDRAEMWQIAAAMPIPVGLAGVATCFEPLGHLEAGAEPNYRSALRRSLAAYWPGLLATGLLSAVLAGLCYRRQRRFAQPWTAVWIAMVFLVGPAGLIGYLFHRRWPALERCPACGRLVPRDREACSSCLAEFPPPTQKGTEVFA
jgi:hypothetical protein